MGDAPKLRWSRANIKALRDESYWVTQVASMALVYDGPLPTEEPDVITIPTFWAPPNTNIKGREIKRLIRSYWAAPSMVDVHIAWQGMYTGRFIVLELDYRSGYKTTIKIAFDLDKYRVFLDHLTTTEQMQLSFSPPPKLKKHELNPIDLHEDGRMVGVTATSKIQQELKAILELWDMLEAQRIKRN